MEIKKTYNKKKYMRKVESMGSGLVLFEVSVVDKKIGQNYHLFFEDKRKPPLDIAINREDGIIEYISYFVQDEMINEKERITKNITKENARISIRCNKFNDNNVNISFNEIFYFMKVNNDIWIIKDNADEKIYAYEIDEANSILFVENEFCGLILHNLSEDEIEQLYDSDCLMK